MQLTQKHAFWRITHQNRSNGLTPSGAKERTKNKKNKKKHRALTFHPFAEITPLDRLKCHLAYWLRHRRNHPCKILCRSIEGFLRGSTPKSAISYSFWNDRYNSSALPCRLWYWCYGAGLRFVFSHCPFAHARMLESTILIRSDL